MAIAHSTILALKTMRPISLCFVFLILSIACNQATQEGKIKEPALTTNPTTDEANASNPPRKVLFSYTFQNDPAYQYQILAKQSTSNQLPAIYSQLNKNGKAIDQHPLNNRYQSFFEKATIARTILQPKLGDAQEILLLTNQEDNEAENASRESSESVEWDSTTLILGMSNNQLIEEIITRSTYSFWYESFDNYELVEKEHAFLPGDKNSLANHLVLETKNVYERIGKDANGKSDTCTTDYVVRKELSLKNGAWNSRDKQVAENVFVEGADVLVYSFPTFCFGSKIGSIAVDELNLLEVSAIPDIQLFEDGEKIIGQWWKIEFPNDLGMEDIGYIYKEH